MSYHIAAQLLKDSVIRHRANQMAFREALTRWHRATKLVPQCDHRGQKPQGSEFGLDEPEANRIERETMRELERTA